MGRIEKLKRQAINEANIRVLNEQERSKDECIGGDCQNGQGTKLYNYGRDMYVGEFKDGKYHGQGTFTWNSGNKFVGEFKNNTMIKGIYTTSGGKYEGEFNKNIFNGQGTWTSADGDKYVGEWKDGKPYNGNLITKSGEKIIYVNGRNNGSVTDILSDIGKVDTFL
jgi:hypothetical protein